MRHRRIRFDAVVCYSSGTHQIIGATRWPVTCADYAATGHWPGALQHPLRHGIVSLRRTQCAQGNDPSRRIYGNSIRQIRDDPVAGEPQNNNLHSKNHTRKYKKELL